MADATIHTGEGGRRKRSIMKPVLWTVGFLVVVAAAATGGALLKKWQNATKPAPPQQVALKAQDAALSGDLTTAQGQIDQALKRQNLSNEDKYLLYYQKGTNFQNQGKHTEAMASFQQALNYKQTFSLYHSMALVAEAEGDIAGAIDYLKKAIPLIGAPPENPVADDDKKAFEEKIKALEAQQ